MDELETIIFRTDRIGDFIISCPFINAYKKKFPRNSITLISSDYNFQHINKFEFISKTIPLKTNIKFFPKLIILIKMIFYLRKNTYQDIIVLDGKARSFIISLFLKGKKSILLQSSKIFKWSKLFKYKTVINNEIQAQMKNFSFLANLLDFKIHDKNPNIYEKINLDKNFNINKKYVILHLDEKWFSDMYYADFTDINPNANDIKLFIDKIIDVLNNDFDLVITSGNKKIENLIQYTSTFTSNDNFKFTKIIKYKKVLYFNKLSFDDLANLVYRSNLLICCEGAISHLSNNFNIPTIALYEKKRSQHTFFWTGHMNKISLFERKNMKNLLSDNLFFEKIKGVVIS